MKPLIVKLVFLMMMPSLIGCSEGPGEKNSCFFDVCVGDRYNLSTASFSGFESEFDHNKYHKTKTIVFQNQELVLDFRLQKLNSDNWTLNSIVDNLGYYLWTKKVHDVFLKSRDKWGYPIDILKETSNIEGEYIDKIKELEVDEDHILYGKDHRIFIRLVLNKNKKKRIKYVAFSNNDHVPPMTFHNNNPLHNDLAGED